MEQNIKEFRDGIFALRTRRFGTVAELMIKFLYGFRDSQSLAYDKKNIDTDERIEVKFSTVMKENDDKIREDNAIEQCVKANLANRAMASFEVTKFNFDCNIQQIKCSEFDVLYYGLFFSDKIEVFKMMNLEVLSCAGYSNKQHRGNEGEGQFHLNQDNIEFHRTNFLQKVITYEELYKLFQNRGC